MQAKDDAEAGEAKIKQHARELVELHEQIIDYKIDNILHVAKICMIGDIHINKSKAIVSKATAEAIKLRREANSNNKDGATQMSRAIGDEPTKPFPMRQKGQVHP